MPPESWAVEKDGDVDEHAGGESSCSEDGGLGSELSPRRISAIPPHANPGVNGFIVPLHGNDAHPNGNPRPNGHTHHPSKRRRVNHANQKHRSSGQQMEVRIYLSNGMHYVAKIGSNVTVAGLTPVLNQKLLLGMDVETHRLYLKERGRGGFSPPFFFLLSFV
jgi:adenylate cyclase